MKKYHPLITGTFILTLTGFASRFIGFFYRIFLSQNFGEQNMGIYQLIYPAMGLAYAVSTSGVQTAISKYVANETTTHDYKSSCQILLAGISISLSLSLMCSILLYRYSMEIATYALLESRCAPLLRLVAISIPFGAIHACINGYFYGIKDTKIPALTQFVEQTIRVSSVFFLYIYMEKHHIIPSITLSVIGIVLGELASLLISLIAIYIRFYRTKVTPFAYPLHTYLGAASKIIPLAIPLSASHVIITLLQSIEASNIPHRLQMTGLSSNEALSIYGVLTGMALPLILFPCAITNSVSVLLLPMISEAQSNQQYTSIQRAIEQSIRYCLLLGFISTCGFFITSNLLGEFLFHSTMASTFIKTLSFICPFLYLSSTLSSILHGLGKTIPTFLFSVISLTIRVSFVFLLIPTFGIKAYLWGVLCSQIIQTMLIYLALRYYVYYNRKGFFKLQKN
ncbi:MAG: polysaccharide biosynthesis protein [Eubacteriales bacterium]